MNSTCAPSNDSPRGKCVVVSCSFEVRPRDLRRKRRGEMTKCAALIQDLIEEESGRWGRVRGYVIEQRTGLSIAFQQTAQIIGAGVSPPYLDEYADYSANHFP